jgi:hypothetical protein
MEKLFKNITRENSKAHASRSKKQRITDFWREGEHDLMRIARNLDTKPSYVAAVLQAAGLISGYHDLYTSTGNAENIYSEEFRGRLGFKDVAAAEKSVAIIDGYYNSLAEFKDRAGQHHCLVMALTMHNRARYIGKLAEAEVFRKWLLARLQVSGDPDLTAH